MSEYICPIHKEDTYATGSCSGCRSDADLYLTQVAQDEAQQAWEEENFEEEFWCREHSTYTKTTGGVCRGCQEDEIEHRAALQPEEDALARAAGAIVDEDDVDEVFDEDGNLLVQVLGVSSPAWTTIGTAHGKTLDGKYWVTFAGDHRPIRHLGEAVEAAGENGEDPPVVAVEAWQITDRTLVSDVDDWAKERA